MSNSYKRIWNTHRRIYVLEAQIKPANFVEGDTVLLTLTPSAAEQYTGATIFPPHGTIKAISVAF